MSSKIIAGRPKEDLQLSGKMTIVLFILKRTHFRTCSVKVRKTLLFQGEADRYLRTRWHYCFRGCDPPGRSQEGFRVTHGLSNLLPRLGLAGGGSSSFSWGCTICQAVVEAVIVDTWRGELLLCRILQDWDTGCGCRWAQQVQQGNRRMNLIWVRITSTML